jgi:hypothetical protein
MQLQPVLYSLDAQEDPVANAADARELELDTERQARHREWWAKELGIERRARRQRCRY